MISVALMSTFCMEVRISQVPKIQAIMHTRIYLQFLLMKVAEINKTHYIRLLPKKLINRNLCGILIVSTIEIRLNKDKKHSSLWSKTVFIAQSNNREPIKRPQILLNSFSTIG